MDAVSTTGRMRRRAPSSDRFARRARAFVDELVDVRDQHDAVEHGDADKGDEADRRRHRHEFAGQPQRQNAADRGEGHVAEHQHRLPHRTEGQIEQEKDQRQRERHDDRKTRCGALLVLKLPAPLVTIARRRLHILRDRLFRLVNEADEIAADTLASITRKAVTVPG